MNFKKLLLASFAVVAMVGIGSVQNARAVTDDGDVVAVIIAPITVDCSIADLDFGDIAASAAIGTVSVDTAGAATDAGGATSLSATTAGECEVAGDAGYPADISITASPVDDAGAGVAMSLSAFVLDHNGGGEFAAPLDSETLVPAGAPLLVGATLNVGANQLAGTYTGTFTVEVLYE